MWPGVKPRPLSLASPECADRLRSCWIGSLSRPARKGCCNERGCDQHCVASQRSRNKTIPQDVLVAIDLLYINGGDLRNQLPMARRCAGFRSSCYGSAGEIGLRDYGTPL